MFRQLPEVRALLPAIRRRRLAIVTGLLAAAFSPARADDEAELARALKFSREYFARTPFVAEVSLQPREMEGLPTRFSYERRQNVERITTEFGQVFARKKRSGWLRLNDWAKTATRPTPNEVADLASRVY